MKKKVLIGMSGGVDSSVAAALLVEQGYEVIGITFKLFDSAELGIDGPSRCCSVEDVMDAKLVCGKLGIRHYVINVMDVFREKVVDYFVDAYQNGKTPNPCIECNRFIKFGIFFEKAKEFGADFIATGHYVRIEQDKDKGLYRLKQGKFLEKDQSYMLYTLTQDQLAHIKMPLGDYSKNKVRKMAEEKGLLVAKKAESQDICFVPNGKYADFLCGYGKMKAEQGDFIDINGKIIGQHKGYFHYTIGQRKGLGTGFDRKLYVKEIKSTTNEVILAEEEHLYRKEVLIKNINWILPQTNKMVEAEIRLRYSQKPQYGHIEIRENYQAKIIFDKPVRAGAKGQAAVFYQGEEVLGGGEIID